MSSFLSLPTGLVFMECNTSVGSSYSLTPILPIGSLNIYLGNKFIENSFQGIVSKGSLPQF